MQHRDRIILQKILSEIDIGTNMVQSLSQEDFLQSELLKRAVSMTAINIGELIKNISPEVRKAHPEVAWREAAGLRDLAAHKYQTLRMEDVYNTALQDFPILYSQLKDILLQDEIDMR